MRAHLPVLFHLATVLFQLLHAILLSPVRLQWNSIFSHTFLNGQHTHRTIMSINKAH